MLSDGTNPEALAPSTPAADGALAGMPAAPGTATGRARVVRDPTNAHIEPGENLVAPTTDPGWTPLFLTAGGLVTETGSPMAHGPTVAREYGIPAVICVRDATELTTGQLITIDGAAGTVTVTVTVTDGVETPDSTSGPDTAAGQELDNAADRRRDASSAPPRARPPNPPQPRLIRYDSERRAAGLS